MYEIVYTYLSFHSSNDLLIEIQMPVIEQTGIQVLSLTENEVTQADFRN